MPTKRVSIKTTLQSLQSLDRRVHREIQELRGRLVESEKQGAKVQLALWEIQDKLGLRVQQGKSAQQGRWAMWAQRVRSALRGLKAFLVWTPPE